MKIPSLSLLLAATIAPGLLTGCGRELHEDMEKQLDRRQVDTYEDEVPVESNPELGREAAPSS